MERLREARRLHAQLADAAQRIGGAAQPQPTERAGGPITPPSPSPPPRAAGSPVRGPYRSPQSVPRPVRYGAPFSDSGFYPEAYPEVRPEEPQPQAAEEGELARLRRELREARLALADLQGCADPNFRHAVQLATEHLRDEADGLRELLERERHQLRFSVRKLQQSRARERELRELLEKHGIVSAAQTDFEVEP